MSFDKKLFTFQSMRKKNTKISENGIKNCWRDKDNRRQFFKSTNKYVFLRILFFEEINCSQDYRRIEDLGGQKLLGNWNIRDISFKKIPETAMWTWTGPGQWARYRHKEYEWNEIEWWILLEANQQKHSHMTKKKSKILYQTNPKKIFIHKIANII